MTRKTQKTILLIIIAFIALCLLFNAYISLPYYAMNSVTFQNLDNQRLSARYSETENGKGVIIACDLQHDKSELLPIVRELKKCGYGIYVFDMPSQGLSEGTIPFKYTSSNYIAEQFYCALVAYTQIADMSVENIHVIGYGDGARAVLQTAALGYMEPAGITLIGTDINLIGKIQFDIINYNIDTQLPWVNALNNNNFDFPIHVIASKADNVSTIKDNDALIQMIKKNTSADVTETYLTMPVHNLMMSNFNVTDAAVSHIAAIDNIYFTADFISVMRAPLLLLAFVLMAYGFSLAKKILLSSDKYAYYQQPFIGIPEHFYRDKLLLWLPAVVLIVLIPAALYYVPISMPYNDIISVSMLCSYGFVMLFMYRLTTFGDALTKQFLSKDTVNTNLKGGLLVFAALLAFVLIASLSGMYVVYGIQSRWLWTILLSAAFSIMFYIDEKERCHIVSTPKESILHILINYMPLFVAPFALIALGLFDSAFTMLTIIGYLVFVLSAENVLIAINSPTKLNAFIKAFIFQLLVFSQSALFLR